MKFIGFNFTKINVEKFSESFKEVKINTHIDISNIEKVNSDLFGNNEETLVVKFSYLVEYSNNHAKIDLSGSVLVSMDKLKSKEILKKWEEKKIQDDFRIPLFNIIFRKSNIKALELEDEMNLPLHIPLPRLEQQPDK